MGSGHVQLHKTIDRKTKIKFTSMKMKSIYFSHLNMSFSSKYNYGKNDKILAPELLARFVYKIMSAY
jgi:hypothetical protein